MRIESTKERTGHKLKIIVHGESGSGKTSLAKTIKDKVLVISSEAGLLCLAGSDVDYIDITRTDDGRPTPREERISKLGEAYKYLLTKECQEKYQWVFLDSLTEISQNLMEKLYHEYPDRKDSLVMYSENAKTMRSIIKMFRDLPHYNVVFTALTSTEKDENMKRYKGINVTGKISEQIPAFFDEVFYLAVIEAEDTTKRVLVTSKKEGIVCKDRSGKLGKFEGPDLQAIYNKIMEVKR